MTDNKSRRRWSLQSGRGREMSADSLSGLQDSNPWNGVLTISPIQLELLQNLHMFRDARVSWRIPYSAKTTGRIKRHTVPWSCQSNFPQSFGYKIFTAFTCIFMCCVSVCVCAMLYMCQNNVGIHSLLPLCESFSSSIVWVLGIELRFSALAISVFIHWAISVHWYFL